jgi:hypothetical protein
MSGTLINIGDPGLSFFTDIDGSPLSVLEWADKQMFYKRTGENRIGKTFLPGGYTISTIWIGMDDQRFETALFHDGVFQEIIARTETKTDAEKMHNNAVSWHRLYLKPRRRGKQHEPTGE